MKFISEENFIIYAARYYNNPSCSTEADFLQDVNKIKFIVKMFKRYEKDGVINERLVLNHIILLYNVFDREAATRMLVLKCQDHLSTLKPFLVLLNFWPDKIEHVGAHGAIIHGTDVMMDQFLVDKLRKI